MTGTVKYHDGTIGRDIKLRPVRFFDASNVKDLAEECKKHREKGEVCYEHPGLGSFSFLFPVGNNWACNECNAYKECYHTKRNFPYPKSSN